MAEAEIEKRIAELTGQINYYNFQYDRNRIPEASDYKFDQLQEELAALEKQYRIRPHDSPTL
jgi:DNA ligase (NAD+)